MRWKSTCNKTIKKREKILGEWRMGGRERDSDREREMKERDSDRERGRGISAMLIQRCTSLFCLSHGKKMKKCNSVICLFLLNNQNAL